MGGEDVVGRDKLCLYQAQLVWIRRSDSFVGTTIGQVTC
jgi:hypothetical protein